MGLVKRTASQFGRRLAPAVSLKLGKRNVDVCTSQKQKLGFTSTSRTDHKGHLEAPEGVKLAQVF